MINSKSSLGRRPRELYLWAGFKFGFVEEARRRGAAPNPAKETFCKKFLWNLQKPLGQKMNEAFS